MNYLKYSNVKLAVDLNPFCWGFKWIYQEPTQRDPHLHVQYVRLLFLSIIVVIDNGEFYMLEETIEPVETKADSL